MRSFPFAFAHVQVVVTRGAPPVDVLRGLARHEAAILPKIFARAGAPPSMQPMNDRGSNATRLEDEPRHCVSQLASADRRLLYRSGFDVVRLRLRHRNYPMRPLSRRITFGMVSPSARAANVNAMRCLSTGSARSSTSSTEGAKRPSRRARARTASINAWLARGPGPHEINLPI